jgi:hypothetical protein
MGYVSRASGREATQEEVASALKTHFTRDEVTNQIGYLRKKAQGSGASPGEESGCPPRHRFNLAGGPRGDHLARAGYFIEEIAAGLAAIRRHAAAALGEAPHAAEIARSLKSSFILSEIKNQIVHARNTASRQRTAQTAQR